MNQRTLAVNELEAELVFRNLPAPSLTIDPVRLQAAILNRRDTSRELNREWEAADVINQSLQTQV